MPKPRRRRSAALATGALALVPVVLSSCGYSGSESSQVAQWAAQQSFTSNEQQVIADVRSLRRAAAEGTALQLRTVCGGLTSDAGTLYDTLPSPDRRLTNELGASMHDFFTAAASCAVASSTSSAAVERDLATIHRGIVELGVAGRRLATDGVRSASVPSK